MNKKPFTFAIQQHPDIMRGSGGGGSPAPRPDIVFCHTITLCDTALIGMFNDDQLKALPKEYLMEINYIMNDAKNKIGALVYKHQAIMDFVKENWGMED